MNARKRRWLRRWLRISADVVVSAVVSVTIGLATACPAGRAATASERQATAAAEQAKAARDAVEQSARQAAIEGAPQLLLSCRPAATNQTVPFPTDVLMIGQDFKPIFGNFFDGHGGDEGVRLNLRGPFVARCGLRSLGKIHLYDLVYRVTVAYERRQPVYQQRAADRTDTALIVVPLLAAGEEFTYVVTNRTNGMVWFTATDRADAKSMLTGQMISVPLRASAGTNDMPLGPAEQ